MVAADFSVVLGSFVGLAHVACLLLSLNVLGLTFRLERSLFSNLLLNGLNTCHNFWLVLKDVCRSLSLLFAHNGLHRVVAHRREFSWADSSEILKSEGLGHVGALVVPVD